MAKTNPVKTVTFTGPPYEAFNNLTFFVIEENEDGVIVNSKEDGKGCGVFLSNESGGWEFDEDYPEKNLTFDRGMMLDFLADSLTEWPKDIIHQNAPTLPPPWYWIANYPSESPLVFHPATDETISAEQWLEARGVLILEARDWLLDTIETWPSKDMAFVSGPNCLPTFGHWEWIIDDEGYYKLEHRKNGHVIDEPIFSLWKLNRQEPYSKYESDHHYPHIEINCSFEDEAIAQELVDVPGYEKLREVLEAAYDQAARGKGKERHAKDLPFHEQRMQTISQLIGSERGMAYQICKKVVEGLDLPTPEARRRELLGAINYIAGVLIYWDQAENGENNDD